MAWSKDELGARFPEPWRLWQPGGLPTRPPEAMDPPEAEAGEGRVPPPAEEVRPPELDGEPDGEPGQVLWHQVQPHEDWATLVARYNIEKPRALLEANGLTEPRSPVPGEWVCVPCHLARPVWELRLDEGGETSHE